MPNRDNDAIPVTGNDARRNASDVTKSMPYWKSAISPHTYMFWGVFTRQTLLGSVFSAVA